MSVLRVSGAALERDHGFRTEEKNDCHLLQYSAVFGSRRLLEQTNEGRVVMGADN